MDLIDMALAAAKGALRGEQGPRVLPRTDGEPAVAFLVTLGRAEGNVVVPLRAGRNLVGRGIEAHRPHGECRPFIAEQGQWLIECGAGEATVWDAGTTNLSVLLPSGDVNQLSLRAITTRGLMQCFDLAGAIALPHPNEPAERYRHPLHEGDVLRGFYAAFVFGWVASLRAST